MANKSKLTPDRIDELAWEYIKDCLGDSIIPQDELPEGEERKCSGERHIPTIQYFLEVWIPMKGEPTICRKTWYNWINHKPAEGIDTSQLAKGKRDEIEEHLTKLHTIKRIDDLFASVATDIVANEGKGIFYAKNRLGMTDKQEFLGNAEQPLFPPLK